MLDTNLFIQKLADQGYTHLVVVPCSFAKNLINASINNGNLIEYVPCASEAVTCSVAAGLSMSGKKPIVIVQSSGLTNMGSCITSLLKPYAIQFPIIVSWRTYKAGDSEIQHAHLATELPTLVAAYGYDHQILNKDDIDTAVQQLEHCQQNFTINLLEKETFSKVSLKEEHQLNLSDYPPRSEYLKLLNEQYKADSTVFIGTTGNTAREMYSFMPDTKNFYMAGNMGGALSVGTGALLAGNNVIVCGGDAEFVMHLGGVTTAGRYNNSDHQQLIYIVFDNLSNKSTGGQNTFQENLDYIKVAEANNFTVFEQIKTSEQLSNTLSSIRNKCGLYFIHIKCSYDKETPRPPLEEVKNTKVFEV